MKSLIFYVLFFVGLLTCNAQTDSIAINNIHEIGIYYLDDTCICKIDPIIYSGIKVGGLVKGKMIYDEENSTNIVSSQVFYVYIPKEMQMKIQMNRFKLVSLIAKKGKRQLTTVSIVPFHAKTGARAEGMIVEKLTDELSKVTPATEMETGHYGIFYDYAGGIPYKLYDFDIE